MTFGSSFPSSAQVVAKGGDTIGVYYTYEAADPNIDSTTIAYSYSDGTTKDKEVTGCRAAATQSILNNFPKWMDMRQKHDSVGQDLVHSWGCNLEDAYQKYAQYRREQFLVTANQYDDVNYAISELSFDEQNVYEAEFRNILYNSSFGILGPGRYVKPEGWEVRRDNLDAMKFDDTLSLWGSRCIMLDGLVGPCDIVQSRKTTLSSGKLNASVYVRTEGVASGVSKTEKQDPDEAGAILVLKYSDGTAKSFGVGFPKNTEDKWVRASFSVTVESELNSFEILIVNRIEKVYYIDLPQVEVNSRASSWTYSLEDFHVYSEGTTRQVGGVQVLATTPYGEAAKTIEVFPVASEEEFKYISIPTRAVQSYPSSDSLATSNQSYGRQINPHGEVMPTKWVVESNRLVEKHTLAPDRFGSHLPAELYIAEDGNRYIDKSALTDGNVDVKAAAVYDGWIYAVTKETYKSKTGYYLKFIKPDKINYEDDFLQSWGDIKLDLNIGKSYGNLAVTEEVNRMGICQNIPNMIFVDTTLDRRFYFSLKYDYFYADFTNRRIFCRENYVAENGLLQII